MLGVKLFCIDNLPKTQHIMSTRGKAGGKAHTGYKAVIKYP